MSTGEGRSRYVDALLLVGEPRVYISLLLVALAVPLPYVLPSSIVHMLILTAIIGTAAVAWNIIGGFGGQFSLGNAVFFGLTGYIMGLLIVTFNFPVSIALVTGLVLTIVAAVIVGLPSFRLTGHYFALATITIVEGMRFLARFFQDVTGGAQGFSLIPATVRGVPVLNLDKAGYFHLSLALFVVAILVSAWVRYSRLGHYLMALRDDQLAAQSLGIDVARYKMYGWLVSALFTGLAGAMYTLYIQFLDPEYMFSITQSVLYAVIPIIGGMGTIAGPVVGTLILFPLQHLTITEFGGRFGAITYVGFGLVLVLLIIHSPNGFLPRVRFIGVWVERRLVSFSPVPDARIPWRKR